MGCASSKPPRCRHCRRPYSPISRSFSMQVHHPPQSRNDSYHVVALTSSTLGSLELDKKINPHGGAHGGGCYREDQNNNQKNNQNKTIEEFRTGLAEAKTWSSIITEKIPKSVSKTPIRTPPGEPETINTWELMEGLEESSPLWSPSKFRSFSFDFGSSTVIDPSFNRPEHKSEEIAAAAAVAAVESHKPLWLQMEEEQETAEEYEDEDDENLNSDFDPEVIESFRKSLQQLSPDHPFHLRPVENTKHQNQNQPYDSKKLICSDKLILYFTSLRGIRKTYEDCCHVRAILRAIGVRVDERDVSMHSGFKQELKDLMNKNGGFTLPRLFIGNHQIGGAEEIRRLHEDGFLEKLLECCEKVENGDGGICEGCGDVRFVPCETCFGSCKVYYEDEDEDEDEDDDDEEEGDYGFQRCVDCNENGLVRCPICCH